MSRVDSEWEREMAMTPQKIWNDFSDYPILRKHTHLIYFHEPAPVPLSQGSRWVFSTAEGGAYDPKWATQALIETIQRKKTKPNYTTLKEELKLAEFVLLVHYGIRGLLHNTPFGGATSTLDATLSEARADLAKGSGPFDRVYLYLAYNEGQLFDLYP
ncbi:MAG: hypothetical protein WA603_24400 [Candidatus Acidiferrales bacterium]